MLTIYTTNSCASCRKAKAWLKQYHIDFREINVMNSPITREDIVRMLKNTENGFEDIISKKSKVIMESGVDVESMTFNEVVEFIIHNPTVLKRPIIIDDTKVQIGYNDEEIRMFIPKMIREKFYCNDCSECEYQKKLEEYFASLKNE